MFAIGLLNKLKTYEEYSSFFCCIYLVVNALGAKQPYKYEKLYRDLPFEMPRVEAPSFPDNEMNLKDFGAVGDGMHLCTESFAKAIHALDKKGGGKLIVPQNLKTEEEWQSVRHFLRPVMVSFIECKNVWLEGVVFQNSPAWNLHPLMCENVLIENVAVRNPSYAQNGDGLDLESCKNALIVNSSFDVGDDGICLKSGKDEDGRRRARTCENVIVDGCTVYKGHGGFVVGSEMSGGVRNISVSNCQFLGTDVGLRFKSKRGRGGVVENIWIRNISMIDIPTEPVTFNLYYGGKSAVEVLESGEVIPVKVDPMPVDETTPCFRNIHIEYLTCSNARRAMYFNGIPEMPIDGITLKHIRISAKKDAEFYYCTNVHKEDVKIELLVK